MWRHDLHDLPSPSCASQWAIGSMCGVCLTSRGEQAVSSGAGDVDGMGSRAAYHASRAGGASEESRMKPLEMGGEMQDNNGARTVLVTPSRPSADDAVGGRDDMPTHQSTESLSSPRAFRAQGAV